MEIIKQQKYPAYKPSGVEWLGEIPEHWEVLPGLRFIYENKDRNKGMIRNTVLSLSYGNIRVKGENELTGLVPESFETYQFVNKGDLIFRPTDLQNDTVSLRSSISEYEGIITNAYLNLRFTSKANSKFYHYFFRAIDNNKVIYGLGSGLRQNISYLDFRRFQFPFPPLVEQTAIANFLDIKTAQIENAIAIKQKQIELLKERRQILIHRAVTRGIGSLSGAETPDVKFKDSGVEWIGEIPEHWEVKALKYCTKIFRGKFTHRPRNDERLYDGNYPFFQTGDVARAGKFLFEYRQTLNDFGLRVSTLFPKGTIVITIAANIGDISILDIDACFPDSIVGFEPMDFVDRDFLYNSLLVMKEQFMSSTIKNTQMNLNVDRIGVNSIAIPSKKEQLAINEYIEIATTKISTAISLKEKEIEKLKEYKSVLINEAVSGKIKVG